MGHRAGWHSLNCNHYFQVDPGEPTPTTCPYCDGRDLRRIDHPPRESPDVAVGDAVTARVGVDEASTVVGDVQSVTPDTVVVDARDGTGRYRVGPKKIQSVRKERREN